MCYCCVLPQSSFSWSKITWHVSKCKRRNFHCVWSNTKTVSSEQPCWYVIDLRNFWLSQRYYATSLSRQTGPTTSITKTRATECWGHEQRWHNSISHHKYLWYKTKVELWDDSGPSKSGQKSPKQFKVECIVMSSCQYLPKNCNTLLTLLKIQSNMNDISEAVESLRTNREIKLRWKK